MASFLHWSDSGKKSDNNTIVRWSPPSLPSASPYRPRILNQEISLTSKTMAVNDSSVHYPAALVIGLGVAGQMALQSVIDQIEIDLHANVERLRFIQFNYGKQVNPLRARHCKVTEINLKSNQSAVKVVNTIGRGAAANAFMHAPKFLDICTLFRDSLYPLRDLRVYFVFSLREPAAGILANVLQLLKRNHADKITMITTFVTLDVPQGVTPLSDGETHAGLLELGRFTHRDIHVMYAPVGQADGTILNQTLIDHLFLVDAEFSGNPELRKKPFVENSGQLLSEVLYIFLHPSSEEIHERRKNILTATIEATQQLNTPIVHSFSLATLHTPVSELQAYVIARLTRAVLLGDPAQAQPGWSQADRNLPNAKQLVKSWLYPPENGHPFFQWLWNIKESSDLTSLPRIEVTEQDGYIALFQWLLLSGVNRFLEQEANLLIAWDAIGILIRQFEKVRRIGEAIGFKDAQRPRWGIIRRILTSLTMTLQSSQTALKEWLRVMYGDCLIETNDPKEPISTLASDIFQVFDEKVPGIQENNEQHIPLKQRVDADVQSAMEALKRISSGSFCISVIEVQDESSGVDEFYKQIVPSGTEGTAYTSLRQRLGWWMHTDNPENGIIRVVLTAILLPERSLDPKIQVPMYYRVKEAAELLEQVRQLAAIRAQAVRAQMTEEWFNRRLWSKRQYLMRAASLPFLAYDDADVDAAILQQKAGSRLGYIIAQTIPQGDKYWDFLFNNLAQEQKRTLPNGEKTRFSALGINSFIPLKTLKIFRDGDSAYRHEANVHLFPQERNARLLEGEIRNDLSDRGETGRARQFCLIAPIKTTLWNRSVERLFFRALACGMVRINNVHQGAFGVDPKRWQVKEFSKYSNIDLASANLPLGLWEAYRQFTLVLPINPFYAPPEINNPLNPFCPENRIGFFNSLLDHCDEAIKQPEVKNIITALLKNMLQMCRSSDQPVLANNFYDLMVYELHHITEPIERFAEPMFR